MTIDQVRLQLMEARTELPEVVEILLRIMPEGRKKWVEYAEVENVAED